MNVDWREKCPRGVEREIATQHARCATCFEYMLGGQGRIGRCNYFVFKDLKELHTIKKEEDTK